MKDFIQHDKSGSKSQNLKILQHQGYDVPPFITISPSVIIKINDNVKYLSILIPQLIQQLSCKSYAVRSSSANEDQENSSMAGQFLTELEVSQTMLHIAILKVINQAKDILKGDLSGFTIIIQKYISPDYSGICFTRNPLGTRELILEYHKGSGNSIVSGLIIPERKSLYRNEKQSYVSLPIDVFKSIERLFGFPQDIERCMKNKKLYIIQTRPITTITKKQYNDILIIEETVSGISHDFLFERNEISEIAPYPTPITLSLLQAIYHTGGPIDNVYKRHHIIYKDTGFISRILGHLYVNRQLELQSLLPAYTILTKNYTPQFTWGEGVVHTIKNLWHLYNFKENKDNLLLLKEALNKPNMDSSIKTMIDAFMRDYEIIFEINLFASISINSLVNIIARENNISINDILSCNPHDFGDNKNQKLILNIDDYDLSQYVGNSLEISDNSKFYTSNKNPINIIKAQKRRYGLPTRKKKLLYPKIINAIHYQSYRECARFLMIKNLQPIKHYLSTIHDGYYYTLSELFDDKNATIADRKRHYYHNKGFTLPSRISARMKNNKIFSNGISSGVATGILVDVHTLTYDRKDQILYTNILTPNLTQYFPYISGIISSNGGLLSHLAIIAREKGMPVIVCSGIMYELGHSISIDGELGTITPLNI